MHKLGSRKRLNTNYNRIEENGKHVYLNDFGEPTIGRHEYDGYIKLKLFHMEHGSIIIPDQIYLKYRDRLLWIQPLFFTANILCKCDDAVLYTQYIDISCGQRIKITTSKKQFIHKLKDNSFLYECKIFGLQHLQKYTTGKAQLVDNIPYLSLYHHTNKEAKENIIKTQEFWTSTWNIQGIKKTTNISFLYLTPLDKIIYREDLEQIAMSSQGKLGFRLDQNNSPKADVILKVARESTENRTHTLNYWVNSSELLSQPIYEHTFGSVYYEIVSPFIHRIGSEISKTVLICEDKLIPKNHKNLDYVVLGDCTKAKGLEAPYDEENTSEILKIQNIDDSIEIFDFWFNSGNSPLYSNIDIPETIQF
ncbi:MAG: hypothetical protein PHR87_07115 [Sulfurospirillaceae bacterium]|nr:hypothetical protein [Sulfurospirillaceae bacterium]